MNAEEEIRTEFIWSHLPEKLQLIKHTLKAHWVPVAVVGVIVSPDGEVRWTGHTLGHNENRPEGSEELAMAVYQEEAAKNIKDMVTWSAPPTDKLQ